MFGSEQPLGLTFKLKAKIIGQFDAQSLKMPRRPKFCMTGRTQVKTLLIDFGVVSLF